MGGQGKMINRKRKFEGRKEDDPEFDLDRNNFKLLHVNTKEKRLIIVLEGAQLETVKVNRTFELLNCDDHAGILRKNQREPGTCRPDITHQCLLMLFDSPLNRAGLLQVFVRTAQNVIIEINPQTRIPRTFKRFAGLMVQLLHKFQVRANETSRRLMSVIKNPITDHLPVGCKKYAMSYSGRLVTNCRELVPKGEEGSSAYEEPVVIVIGAFAHGTLNTDYTEELISISRYPLSAAIACSKLCSAFEEVWGVV
ncbi:PREDICTED: ribosomal RNA small subunit methyltransferase NEP1 [Drosophila arizonae]|uniref:Ribosomal RNA small subunit methyltransferase NEP1 n=1 Tax=Drosophila arizonae TaxID=7263 RepID=A0ABM1PY75_DROAR|nr:PREDICTED: ribosomal RNA small subunit methyltransferase NEP1 [Drosophila arizonae]